MKHNMDKVFNDLRARDAAYHSGTFFKIQNSELLKRLSDSSGILSDDRSLTYFVILTMDSVIEIIAHYEPEIQFFENA